MGQVNYALVIVSFLLGLLLTLALTIRRVKREVPVRNQDK
jgi:ABC-type arginine/histidine transport system permease subunit